MKRVKFKERTGWRQKCSSVGFNFYDLTSEDGRPYWNETTGYELTMEEVDLLEDVTSNLYQKCLQALEYIITNDRLAEFDIPEKFWPLIKQSWHQKDTTIYGRFDLNYYGGSEAPKLLEFNADTPTSLIESAVVQWFWMKDQIKNGDQFNIIHELLIENWKTLRLKWQLTENALLHLASSDTDEDMGNTHYMAEVASQAGFNTKVINIESISWNHEKEIFEDEEGLPIRFCFKLYPWEWMLNEEYGKHLLTTKTKTLWIEPIWKSLLSNKQILVVLWELFPGHPNLLPAYNDAKKLLKTGYVKKPKLSREGANITIYDNSGKQIIETQGIYLGDCIYQQFYPLPKIDKKHYVIGSWIIGDKPAGLDFRETSNLITGDLAEFVPHYIKD